MWLESLPTRATTGSNDLGYQKLDEQLDLLGSSNASNLGRNSKVPVLFQAAAEHEPSQGQATWPRICSSQNGIVLRFRRILTAS